jgi:hypothetical protein
MMVSSRYLMSSAPTTCGHCKQPLPVENGQVVGWRTSTGRYFCNEFCAEEEEEVAFQDQRRASGLSTTRVQLRTALVRKDDLRFAKRPN